MVLLTVILAVALVAIVLVLTVGAGVLLCYGDLIIAALILYGIVKLISKFRKK